MKGEVLRPWFIAPVSPPIKRVGILGAGIAGVSLAYALAKRGVPSLLFEKGALAQGASGNPAGLLMPYLTADFSHASQFSYAAFRFAQDLLNRLSENNRIDFDLSGLIEKPSASRQASRLRKIAQHLSLADQVRWHEDSAELFYQQAGWVAPQTWLEAMLADSGDQVVVHTSCEIEQIEGLQEGAVLHAHNQSWPVSHWVDARGFELGHSWQVQVHAQIQPVRGQVSWIEGVLAHANGKPELRSKYRIPFQGGVSGNLMGASFGPGDFSLEIRDSEHQDNCAHWIEDVHAMGGESMLQGRVSWRGMLADHLPVVGPAFHLHDYRRIFQRPIQSGHLRPQPFEGHPWQTGGYLLGGFGSHGLNLAPFCSDWLADLLLNQHNNSMRARWISMIHPARFVVKKMARGDLYDC